MPTHTDEVIEHEVKPRDDSRLKGASWGFTIKTHRTHQRFWSLNQLSQENYGKTPPPRKHGGNPHQTALCWCIKSARLTARTLWLFKVTQIIAMITISSAIKLWKLHFTPGDRRKLIICYQECNGYPSAVTTKRHLPSNAGTPHQKNMEGKLKKESYPGNTYINDTGVLYLPTDT